jgi:hypothetical protein
MKKLFLLCVCGGLFSMSALAADPYEAWLTEQHNRGTEIELIRVASEKPLVATEETDEEVASILEEVEALEAEASDQEDAEESS